MTKLKMTRLGDLFEITSSKRVHKEDWQTAGVPFLRAREIVQLFQTGAVRQELYITEEMYSQFKSKYGVPQPDDLLVTGVGTLGICYRVRDDSPFYFKDGNIIWLKKRHDEDSRYIEYAFQSDIVRDQIMEGSQGATVGTYTIEKANETLIPLPPLPEQQRIVTKLDAAFGALREAEGHVERNRANARELFESYLNGVFEGKEGWEICKLGDLCSTITKGTTPTTHGYSYQAEGVNFIKVESVSEDHDLLPDMFAHVSDECHDFFKRSQLRSGDILFSIAGALGRVAVVKEDHLPANTNQALAIVRLNDGAPVGQDYLVWLLSSGLVVQQTSKMAGGAAQQNLSLTQMKDLDITYPSKTIQKRIVEDLTNLKRETKQLESTYQQKLRELEMLKKSVLGAAFSGEL